MSDGAATGPVGHAERLASKGDWQAALDLLMDLDGNGTLDVAQLPLLAEVAYAAGHLDVTITAWERVHRARRDAGEPIAAAAAAARVAMHLLFDTALMAPVRGWLRRAERLLENQPESGATAWHAVVRSYERLLSGDVGGARHWARRAVDTGSRFDPAACAIGRVADARLRVLDGEVDEGLTLLEEVGVDAVSGDLDPLTTGVVYCELVCALQGMAQYDLAEQWTEAMERWCRTNAIGSLHGRCRVHRAEILRLRGAYRDAEAEVLAACDELRPYLRRELGWPLTELGHIRLLRGDVAGAEEALLAAHEAGWDPQPGLARVRLAEGDVGAAAQSISDTLGRPFSTPSKERPPSSGLHRAPLLEAQVEIELARGQVEAARAAADELDAIATRFKSSALRAGATVARGRLALADGRAADAGSLLAEALQVWRTIGAPYEMATTQQLLGEALRSGGQAHRATVELETARRLFEQLDQAHRSSPVAGVSSDPRREGGNRMEREGDLWAISFAGRVVRVKDLKGIGYLALLVAHPGREFHALDLVGALERTGGAAVDRGDAGALLDDQARTAYRRRLAEIEEDIDEARALGDLAREQQAEVEREFLVRELSRAFGVGGARRRAGAASERARVAVTRAVRTAIGRIAEHHDALGSHLDHAVRTGTYCSYQPDPASPVMWEVRPPSA